MIKFEKFTGTKAYMYPDGSFAPAERIMSDFPAIQNFPHVIEVMGDVCAGVHNLNLLRQLHDIDEALTEDEAIQAIQDIRNTPVEQAISAEERIAAAMEYQNIMNY